MPEESEVSAAGSVLSNQLTVYITQPAAPLCERVRAFLESRGYAFTIFDVVSDEDRAAMKERTGYSSCPLVVAGDHVVGKLTDTIEADRSGRLAALLATDAPDPARTQERSRDA